MRRVISAAVVVTTMVVGVSVVPVAGLDESSAHAATKSPSSWDPRVRTFVKFVEHDRDLKFEHPVAVEFLGDAAFVKALNAGDEPTKADREQAVHDAAQLRATGMIGPGVDLVDTQGNLDDTSTTGFYDPDTKKLYVRGTDLTDTDVRLTIVHELTHALQDQHFDLGKLDARVRDSGESFAETALIEGDAVTVENDYFFTLPQREQDAYNASLDDPARPAAGASSPVPDEAAAPASDAPVLDALDSAPYDYGSQFVSYVFDDRGAAGVDALFRTLPRTAEQIIDPVATHRREPAVAVATPKLAPGEQAVGDPDVWGALSLYLVLAARIDGATALRAATGWGGDAYRAFTRADGTECVRVAIAGDTAPDTTEIADALAQWAAQMPPGGVVTDRTGDLATFTACDVGGVTSPDAQRISDASDLLYDRNHFAQNLAGDGVAVTLARCAGAQLAQDPQVVATEWADHPSKADRANQKTRTREAVRACGG